IPTATILPPNLSGERALGYVRGLAVDIGSRPSNSPASQQAAQDIQRQLSSLGYSARIEDYSFSQFQDQETELLVKQPELVELAAKSFIYTGSGVVEGPLLFCGLGQPSDFPDSTLAGQIALIERGGGLTFEEKVSNAMSRDVAGVIVYNDRNGEFRGALAREATVPVVAISQEDGKRLSELIGKGPVVVGMKVEAKTESFNGSNVVAVHKGTDSSKKLVVGGHYDSVSVGPGANDNASGVGTLLELASAVRGREYPFDIVFVAFGDEEIGLIGSKKYVESLGEQERSQIVAMVNLDMVGVGDHFEIEGDKDLADHTIELAISLGYEAREMALKLGMSSDHASFLDAQIPAVFIHRVDDPYYHTKQDAVDNIAAEHLEAAGKIAYYLIEELARRN
ncbi:MAG: M20/M25/M40 family metallo-hydrolase, partial [Chloroflexota bacterium]